MNKAARSPPQQKKRKTGAGKAPAAGVGYQCKIAAWAAVHILAGRPLRNAFGINVNACPRAFLQEQQSTYAVDDLVVHFEPSGRLLIQATTDLDLSFGTAEKPSKLRKSLLQAFAAWHRFKTLPQGAAYVPPLARFQDAIILAVPRDAPASLSHLHKAFRRFDGVDRWADAGLAELNQQEDNALDKTLEVLRSAYAEATGGVPGDNDLVELLGLIHIVRMDVEQGQADQDVAVNLLRDHILAEQLAAPKVWTHLVQHAQELMRSARGIDRGGLERNLRQAGYELKQSLAQQLPQVEQSLPEQLGNTTDSVGRAAAKPSPAQIGLPAHFAETQLAESLRRVRQRLNFRDATFDYTRAVTDLAQDAIDGELQLASPQLRFEVLEFAVRANASGRQTASKARQLLDAAKRIYPAGSWAVAEAALLALDDLDAAMRQLRDLKSPQAKSLLFSFVVKSKGEAGAHVWVKQEKLVPGNLGAVGVFNVICNALTTGDFEFAADWIEQASEDQLSQLPALRFMRGQLRLASCMPEDQRLYLLQGLPPAIGAITLAQDADALAKRRNALEDFRQTLEAARQLGVPTIPQEIDELILWLRLLDPASSAEAKSKLDAEIREPALILWRARLALAFGSQFDQDALRAELQRRRATGGWTAQEASVAVALELASNDPARIAAFMAEARNDLTKVGGLPPVAIACIEIEALARSGAIDQAKGRLAQHATLLEGGHRERLTELIAESEGIADPVENARRRFAQSKLTDDLGQFCAALAKKDDFRGLCQYGVELARRTRSLLDLRPALKALARAGNHRAVIQLIDELAGVGEDDDSTQFSRARAFFHMGDVRQARKILDQKFPQSTDPAVIRLAIFIAWEAGEWGHIQGIIDKVAVHAEDFDPAELARFALLARDIGSPHAKMLIEAATKRGGNDPHVYLAAYLFAVHQGTEAKDARVHEWFQRAIELSGQDGPIERKSLREVADMAPGWREHQNRINQLIKSGDAPLFLAARSLHVTLTSASLGRAFSNVTSADPRGRFPILAFHGARRGVGLAGARTLALDISALLTLSYLGLLENAISSFDKIIIGAGTLTSLFREQQRIRFHQPSRIAKAKRLKAMIDGKRLKVLDPPVGPVPKELVAEVGEDLAQLLVAARLQSGLVVQPGPLHKAGSFLEELAQLGLFSEQITDTRQVLAFLTREGALSSHVEQEALTYINQVDRGMPDAKPIGKKTPLFLDELAVFYLDYTNSLAPLADRVGPLAVSRRLLSEVEALIQYEAESERLLEQIENLRTALASGIGSGKVEINETSSQVSEALEDDDELQQSPSMALLRSVTHFDAIIADDRGLNRWSNWEAAFGTAPIATTVDVIDELRRRDVIHDAGQVRARYTLRQANFQLLAAREDELLALLKRAPLVDGSLQETPELRSIREDLYLAIAKNPLQAAEEPWIHGTRLAILNAIRALWADDGDAIEPRADWLLSILPDLADFALRPVDPKVWEHIRLVAAMETTAFFNCGSAGAQALDRHKAWVQSRIVAPLQDADPGRLEHAVALFKTFVEGVADGAKT